MKLMFFLNFMRLFGGLAGRAFAPSEEGCWFGRGSGQVKELQIGIYCFPG